MLTGIFTEFESAKCGDDVKLEKKADGGQIPIVSIDAGLLSGATEADRVPIMQVRGTWSVDE